MADSTLHVLGQVIDEIFGLAEGDIEHEFALRGILEPERGEFKSFDMPCIQEVNDSAAINGVAGEAIRMPSDNTLRLALLEPFDHFIEDRAAWNFGCHGLYEFFLNGQAFSFSEETNFGQLSFNGENLSLFAIGGFARIEEESGHRGLLRILLFSILSNPKLRHAAAAQSAERGVSEGNLEAQVVSHGSGSPRLEARTKFAEGH